MGWGAVRECCASLNKREDNMASFMNIIFKVVTGVHIFLYRRSGGKVWTHMVGLPVLLLITTGKKTGLQRTTPVVYLRDGNDYLIAASAGGIDKNPTWFGNLEHKPEAKIEIAGKIINVKVVIETGAERDRLYELFKTQGTTFEGYERSTSRKIPVVRLQPIGN
jgi:deazaflavin-dependent oxidoreductase (nitroreductase family)